MATVVHPMDKIEITSTTPQETTSTPTTNLTAGMIAINSITSAYSAYEAGQMKKLAYEHEAAMAELNARQIEIDTQFYMADRMEELSKTLALQNVISAATGRRGGSVESVAQTSIQNLKKEERRVKETGKARKVATLMDVSAKRAAGETASKFGLLEGITELSGGAAKAGRFIS